jgi:hypothetical protein
MMREPRVDIHTHPIVQCVRLYTAGAEHSVRAFSGYTANSGTRQVSESEAGTEVQPRSPARRLPGPAAAEDGTYREGGSVSGVCGVC